MQLFQARNYNANFQKWKLQKIFNKKKRAGERWKFLFGHLRINI